MSQEETIISDFLGNKGKKYHRIHIYHNDMFAYRATTDCGKDVTKYLGEFGPTTYAEEFEQCKRCFK